MATTGSTAGEGGAALQEQLRGEYVDRDGPGYDEARALYNAMIDKRPLGIARCEDVADVIEDIVEAYLALRARPDELFVDTVKRLGVEPFRERVYATR